MANRSSSPLSLFAFAMFWSLIVGVFLCFSIYSFTNQYRTLSFHTTTGAIDSIERTVSHSSKGGSTYGIKVSYHYTVAAGDGAAEAAPATYTSTRLRYGAMSSNDDWADTILQRFPRHRPATVYYNPNNPAESVLLQGFESRDFFLLLFLTPFVLVGALMWFFAFRSLSSSHKFRGLHITETGNRTRIRPPFTRPLVLAMAILGGGSFVSVFILAFGSRGRPGMTVVLATFIILILAAVSAAAISLLRILTGTQDVVIDDDLRKVTFPGQRIIPFEDLTEVRIDPADNINVNNQPLLYVRIYFAQDSTHDHYTLKWTSDRDLARQLASYLSLRLSLPAFDAGQPLLAPAAISEPGA